MAKKDTTIKRWYVELSKHLSFCQKKRQLLLYFPTMMLVKTLLAIALLALDVPAVFVVIASVIALIGDLIVADILNTDVDEYLRVVGKWVFAQEHHVTYAQLEKYRFLSDISYGISELKRHLHFTQLCAAPSILLLLFLHTKLFFILCPAIFIIPSMCMCYIAHRVGYCHSEGVIVRGIETQIPSAYIYRYTDERGHQRTHYTVPK